MSHVCPDQLRHIAPSLQRGRYNPPPSFVVTAGQSYHDPAYLVAVKDLADQALEHFDHDRLDEAEGLFRDALSLFDKVPLERPDLRAVLLNNLGNIVRHKGEDDAEAERLLRKAIDMGGPERAKASYNLALLLGVVGRTDDAVIAAERASDTWKQDRDLIEWSA